jgi:hypothetical protein
MLLLLLLLSLWSLLLSAIGLTPGGSGTVTFTHKQYTEFRELNMHNSKKYWELRAVRHLCELCPGICLTTEEKARENLS